MARGCSLRGIVLAISLAAMLSFGAVAEVVPRGWWFEHAGLAWDQKSLIGYLKTGFPEPITPEGEPSLEYQLPFSLWNRYADILGLLEDSPDSKATLRDLSLNGLPEPLVKALLLNIAMEWSNYDDYDDWDRRSEAEITNVRLRCANRLAVLGGDEAEEVAENLVQWSKGIVRSYLSDQRVGGQLAGSFGALCVYLAERGNGIGLEALIEILPDARDTFGGNNIIYFIKRIAGPRFAIETDMPQAMYRESVREWQTWWDGHRASFTAPEELWSPERRDEYYTYPPPAHAGDLDRVLSHVRASVETASAGDVIYAAHPEAEEWLARNAQRYRKELRRIADEKGVDRLVREAALSWYVKVGGRRAVRFAHKHFLAWEPARADHEQLSPQSIITSLREQYTSDPEAALAVSKSCVERVCGATPVAVTTLLAHGRHYDGLELVLTHYEDIVRAFPEVRCIIAEHFLDVPEQRELKIIVDVLRSGDTHCAAVAVDAVAALGLVDDLPSDVGATYSKWLEDLGITLKRIQAMTAHDRERATRELLSSVSGRDMRSARIYAFGYAVLGFTRGEVTPEGRHCLEALKRCVQAHLDRDSNVANPVVVCR